MIQVETQEGIVLYINPKQVLMIGSVIENGGPILNMCRVMLLGGIAIMVKGSATDLSAEIASKN